jgi:hypothetical protein
LWYNVQYRSIGHVKAGMKNHQKRRIALFFTDPAQTRADGPPIIAPERF